MSTNENKENTINPPTADKGRRQFLKYAAVGAVGVGLASAVEIPVLSNLANEDTQKLHQANQQVSQLQSQVQSDTSQINNLQSQVSDLQSQLAGSQALATLSINEAKAIEAIAETIIPSDSSGPGAKEAGVLYFIDNRLASDWGNNARMYMKGPFVLSGQPGPITVEGITYSQGTPTEPYPGPTYQYNMTMREFWRNSIDALQAYSNQAYGKNIEDLNNDQRIEVLTQIYDNKPTSFNGIVPKDFFNELIFMTYSGFFMDPLYGGNKNMVGWTHTGFTGANMGDTFNTGRDVMQLMVADKPTRFSPRNLGQFQQAMNLLGGT